jgi:sulfatase maturation enzyme AslB (radical SAM superfamily)
MELSNLTFIITDKCNFNCSYCYQGMAVSEGDVSSIPTKKGMATTNPVKATIDEDTIKKTLNLFYPYFKSNEKISIGFYGGEPLLAFDKIKYAVQLINEKNNDRSRQFEFLLTTNGSLITNEILAFLSEHRFSLTLSYDGLAQDMGRKKGTIAKINDIMKQIQTFPDIQLEINSVFSPLTIAMLCDSMDYLIAQGATDITYNLSNTDNWNASDLNKAEEQLEQLSEFMLNHFIDTGSIPLRNFRNYKSTGSTFQCSAGTRQMTVTPIGQLWGCFLFHDYFNYRRDNPQFSDFSFGSVQEFEAREETFYNRISTNYAELRQDFFQVGKDFCFTCDQVDTCMSCPINAAYSSGAIGQISCKQCALSKMQTKVKNTFTQAVETINL